MAEQKKLAVLVEPGLGDKIEAAAASERRSISNMASVALAQWVEARDRQQQQERAV